MTIQQVLVEGEVSIEISEARRDGRGRTGQEILEALMALEASKPQELQSSKAQKLIGPRRLFMSPATCNKIWRERGRLNFGARKLFSRFTIPQST